MYTESSTPYSTSTIILVTGVPTKRICRHSCLVNKNIVTVVVCLTSYVCHPPCCCCYGTQFITCIIARPCPILSQLRIFYFKSRRTRSKVERPPHPPLTRRWRFGRGALLWRVCQDSSERKGVSRIAAVQWGHSSM